MKNLVVLLGLILISGCKIDKDSKANKYLQSEAVALVAPTLVASNLVIDSVATLKASLPYPDVEIHYTSDGTAPDETSPEYTEPIKVTNPGVYSFKAYHPFLQSSEISTVTFYKSGIKVREVSMLNEINAKYPGNGVNTLIDNQKGSNSYSDGRWMGFDEDVVVELEMPSENKATKVIIGNMSATGAWIFSPAKITVWVSDDKQDYTQVGMVEIETEKKGDDTALKNVEIPINRTGKYFKIKIENLKEIPQWHDGKGTRAWHFIDEIIIDE
ncbi:chitobiase/beta-hexosaminidase C-terminal domain-containing protein [Zhouia amylolytica]|uniref:GH29D-like beta-sandwich domain-containing protein n=1 Tax=Zhouia amylolytica AD3 TaxID=1286632 RepID=W2UJJ9_9FLAO|nr:chitobiase/beta-hexosaminidase C-terminal domain-containing protein [Zhouia amylolytica]ETN94315.1 hypothetical protein P278_22570 [Zhouia amylolytica AD3]